MARIFGAINSTTDLDTIYTNFGPNGEIDTNGGRVITPLVELFNGGLIWRKTNSNYSFVYMYGDIGVANTGYLMSEFQAILTGAQLISNGDFETGDFTGWTLTGVPAIAGNAFAGDHCAECTDAKTIKQTIVTVENTYYLLEFAAKSLDVGVANPIVTITGGDIAAYNPGVQISGEWIRGAALIKASGISLVLEFSANVAGTVYFDEVSLKTVSQYAMMGMDSDGKFFALNSGGGDTLITAAQTTKLAGIATGAQVNVLEGVTGTAPIVAGAIAAKSQAISISAATTSTAGSMSAADFNSLRNGWIPAPGTWTYSSVDDPTGVLTVDQDLTSGINAIALGDKIQFTNGGNVIYGKVSKTPTFSTPNTTITFLHQIDPTDNLALVLMADSAITLPYYSHVKNPYGFPTDLTKWQILITDPTDRSQGTPLANTIYNIGTTNAQISVPIGCWDLGYSVFLVSGLGTATYGYPQAGLSTANNTFSDLNMVAAGGFNFVSGQVTGIGQQLSRRKLVTLTTKTLYYLNGQIVSNVNPSTLLFYNSLGAMQLYAISTL